MNEKLRYIGKKRYRQHVNKIQYEERYDSVPNISRKCNPYDNAIMESFYRPIKRELVQGAAYDNPEQAQLGIFKYIETYYNTKHIHSALGYLSPSDFEAENP